VRERDDHKSSKAVCRNTIGGHEHSVVGGADETMKAVLTSTARGTASVLKYMVIDYVGIPRRSSAHQPTTPEGSSPGQAYSRCRDCPMRPV
jgi:hypothetical protein